MKKIYKYLLALAAPALILGAASSCSSDDGDEVGSEANIITMTIDSEHIVSQPVITGANIEFTVSSAAESLVFAPVITVSEGATVSPASGVNMNFETPQEYVVTAKDGTTKKTYTVTCTVVLDDNAGIEEMIIINGDDIVVGDIEYDGTNIDFYVRHDVTDAQLAAIELVFELSSSRATIEPVTGQEPDFSEVKSAEYIVTPEDADKAVTYTVTCNVIDNTEAFIRTFNLTGDDAALLDGAITIDDSGDAGYITFTLSLDAPAAEVTLSPAITVSPGATVSPASGSATLFTYDEPYVYTVTAQDGTTTRAYHVTVSKLMATDADITAVTLSDAGAWEATVFNGAGRTDVELFVVETVTAEELAALDLEITTSDNAVLTPDASNPATLQTGVAYKYTVTSEDGLTVKEYTVTLWKRRVWGMEDWVFTVDNNGNPVYVNSVDSDWKNTNPIAVTYNQYVGMGMLTYSGEYMAFQDTDSQSGDYAARMVSRYADASALHVMTLTGVPSFAPGMIMFGNYTLSMFDYLAGYSFNGISFSYEAMQIRAYYTYQPGTTYYQNGASGSGSDSFSLTAILYEDTGANLTGSNFRTASNIVARAEFIGSAAQTQYTQLSTALNYTGSFDSSKNYKLAIIASASANWDTQTGADGSELKIDNVEVLFK